MQCDQTGLQRRLHRIATKVLTVSLNSEGNMISDLQVQCWLNQIATKVMTVSMNGEGNNLSDVCSIRLCRKDASVGENGVATIERDAAQFVVMLILQATWM